MNYLNFSQEVKRIIAQIFPKTPIKSSQYRICAQLNQLFTKVYFCSSDATAAATQAPSAALGFGTVQSETYCRRAVQHIHLFYKHIAWKHKNLYNLFNSM